MLVDFYIVKKKNVDAEQLLVEDSSSKYWFKGGFNWPALITWFIGIAIYNVFSYAWTAIGACVPTFIIICILYLIVGNAGNKEA